MHPVLKYSLARIGLFLAVLLALWPVQLNLLLKLMIAILFSAGLSFFLLRRWRDQVAEEVSAAVLRRRAERDRLRKALAGEDDPAGEHPERS